MKKILITGGTGSFGSTMLRRLLKEDKVEEIVVFSRDELKQHEMRVLFNSSKIRFIVGDVRDLRAVQRAMQEVDTVFHAAALKQVPSGEYFPMELVQTNVLGTQNVIDAAEESLAVKKVIFLSTDKAVYPVNTMGISKALAERLVTSKGYREADTTFCIVRYGNVMASRGSVIPLFVDKIKQGRPLTITDPSMTRFLLSLEDAIDLVLLAIEKGNQGDLFIKKAPAATIDVLAKALLKIYNADNPIEIMGTRAGEKVHETLATSIELGRAEDLEEYFRIKTQVTIGPEYFLEKGMQPPLFEDYTSENTTRLDVDETAELLMSLDFIKKDLDN